MDLERNKAVVREFDELGNGTGDLGRLEELCTPDMVNHALAPGRAAGLAGTREFLEARHRRGRPAPGGSSRMWWRRVIWWCSSVAAKICQ
jgi:hypothetical protein